MAKRLGIILSLILFLLCINSLLAQPAEKSDNVANSIKEVRPGFQVFPQGKFGNTLYQERKKIVSRADLILRDIMEAPDGFVYFGTNKEDENVLGYAGPDTASLTKLDDGFYQLVTGNGIRKLYRVFANREIEDLLPRSNTANGLVYNNVDKAAFFHITSGQNVETEDGTERYQYSFKIHIVKDNSERIEHLQDTISDFRSRLKLSWLDKDTLQYTLSNDQTEIIVIK